ncbi:methyl jasmonate esterase 1-like [Apium graveolens]|uniref:methyl jasmonate esterase 1-like n=1 Tax=Apium graveolens TaxID=4045 RepID=UPI003D7A2345
MDKTTGKHFVLVHGACHGAWCWYKVATLLRSKGHKVTILDLAASGVNEKQAQDVHSFSVFLEPLMEFMDSVAEEDKVVLVGHSMGGVGLSVAMERFPQKIAVAVFATAYMLSPDLDLVTISSEVEKKRESFMDSQLSFDKGLDGGPTSVLFGPKLMESKMYQLSPPEDLTLATMLVRPYSLNPHTDAKSLDEIRVTKERFGLVPRVYVVADQDILLLEEMQRWMIESNPPEEVKVIKGSDHMIMFSKPRELFVCLEEISQQYC